MSINKQKLNFNILFIAFSIFVITMLSPTIVRADSETGRPYGPSFGDDFDTSTAINISTEEQLISLLKNARKNHQESVIVRINPNQIELLTLHKEVHDENGEKWEELSIRFNNNIWEATQITSKSGLYSYFEYDLFGGPSCQNYKEDPKDSNYVFYNIRFDYHDNDEELAAADAKLRSIMAESPDKSDAGKIKYLIDWMQKNIAKEKLSNTGYPRNCSGVYGCLFLDGTGFCCSTYAETIQRYAELAGIDAYLVSSVELCHVWNAVKLDNQWYMVDYTSLNNEGEKIIMVGTDTYKRWPNNYSLVCSLMAGYPLAKNDYYAIELTKDMFEVNTDDYYTFGEEYKLQVNPTEKWKNLICGVDYDITYENNTKPGKATMTIEGLSKYKGILQYTFTIKDTNNITDDTENKTVSEKVNKKQKTTAFTDMTAGKKSLTLTWKKQSKGGIKGYEIQYSTNKKFQKDTKTVTINKNKTTTKTIKKLKPNKKYYIRIRTFTKKNGKTVYSKWSKTKQVKTK